MLDNKIKKARESGFTLIELMVVVLIIAILIAIAIPTFIGMRDRAYDSQARSNLRNTLSASKAYYSDHYSYGSIDATTLKQLEHGITFIDENVSPGCTVPMATNGSNADHSIVDIFTLVASGDVLCLTVWSKGSKKWFYFSSSGKVEELVIR